MSAGSGAAPEFETLLYGVADAVATITLNRPDSLNTIVPPMPEEVEAAVGLAVRDPAVKVIVLRGAGRAFCAGYDFGGGFHHWDEQMNTEGEWDPGKDFAFSTAPALAPTQKLMSVWRAPKPVIAQVHGWCLGGGSDFALCADLVIASEDARIGTPYSRIWGAYLSGMWIYRLGLAKAKEHALTGRPLSGVEAAEVELINRAVPFARLEDEVARMLSAARSRSPTASRSPAARATSTSTSSATRPTRRGSWGRCRTASGSSRATSSGSSATVRRGCTGTVSRSTSSSTTSRFMTTSPGPSSGSF